MRYYRTVAPTVAPISLDEAKLWVRRDDTDDDTLLNALITAATVWLDGSGNARDGILGRALITQTWVLEAARPLFIDVGDNCKRSAIRIAYGPIQGITSVQVMLNGVYSTWSSSKWRLGKLSGGDGFLVPVEGESWPSYDANREDAFKITYVAGYGDAASDVPEPLRIAMQLVIGGLEANRESQTTGPLDDNPAVMALIAPFRVFPV